MGPWSIARLLVATFLLPTFCLADSQVRIVRLSSVDGDVQIDRNLGQGLEKAFLNLPITQGVKIQTGNNGRAEVEFEDGSVARLAPNSGVEFSQLTLKDAGGTVSGMKVQQGTVYVNFRGSRVDDFTVLFVREKVNLRDAVRLRIQLNDAIATFAVFKGNAQVEGNSGKVEVGKNDAVTFDLANHDQYEPAKLEDAPFDNWDKDQDKYHSTYLSKKHDYSANAYGVSDLNYYGSFFDAPGYGRVWQPYFVSAGWDPFMDGGWAWYPGTGYTWVSAYPWGWTPYHCGSWLFGPSFGWAWQPGGCGSWFGFPTLINAPSTFQRPRPPAGTPGRGTVVMRPRPILSSMPGSAHRMVIQNNSAGLGVPRGSIRGLSHLSLTAQKNGSATATFRTPAMSSRPMMSNPGMARPSMSSNTSRSSAPVRSAPSPPMGAPRSTGVPRSAPRK